MSQRGPGRAGTRAYGDRRQDFSRRAGAIARSHGGQSIEAKAGIAAPTTPAEFAAFIKKEIETWRAVVSATGTKPGN